MQCYLHGFRRIDMTDRQTGQPIRGYSLFISYTSDGVTGVETAKEFVRDDLVAACGWTPEINQLVNIDYTPKGRVSTLATVREK